MQKIAYKIISGRFMWLFICGLLACICCLPQAQPDDNDISSALPYAYGEHLFFQLSIAGVQVGQGHLYVDSLRSSTKKNPQKEGYHFRAYGKTTGAWRRLYDISDLWGSHYTLTTSRPLRFYRRIHENKYRKYEITTFYNAPPRAVVRSYADQRFKHLISDTTYALPASKVYDVLSSIYHLRSLNMERLFPGDWITLPIFYVDTHYRLRIRYTGTERIVTAFGLLKAYVFAPVMPQTKLFQSGEHAVRLWVSADKNKLPLRAEARMFIANIRIDLVAVRKPKL